MTGPAAAVVRAGGAFIGPNETGLKEDCHVEKGFTTDELNNFISHSKTKTLSRISTQISSFYFPKNVTEKFYVSIKNIFTLVSTLGYPGIH